MAAQDSRVTRIWRSAAPWALGGLGIAVLTVVAFRLRASAAGVALLYMLAILLISLRATLAVSVVASVVAALALDYFFTPPLFRISISDSIDFVAAFAFVTTAVVVARLLGRLRKSEQQWRDVFENNPTMYFIVDSAGTVLSVNPFGAEQLGYTVDELVGQSVLRVFYEPDREAVQQHVANCLAHMGRSMSWELRKVRKDGSMLWVRETARAVLRAPKQPIVLVACEDITQRKQAEEQLRRSQAYLAEAQRLSQTGSFGWSPATEEIVWSDETYRIMGLDPSTKPNVDLIFQRIHPDDRASVRGALDRAARSGEGFDLEQRLVTLDGSVKYVHVVAHPVRDDDGHVEFVGASMDVTEQRRATAALEKARDELARMARLTTMGELVASIAHEIRQPLAAIVINGAATLRWLNREEPDLAEARDGVSRIVRDAGRAEEVIRGLRTLADKSGPRLSPLDLTDTIQEVLTLTQGELQRQGVSAQTELDQSGRRVLGDRVQLQQVLLNLLMNGVEAMSAVADRPRVLTIRSEATGPSEVVVSVEDTGRGLDPATANRVFDPFFTTKPNGLGLGLSICRSIIDAHGGRLWAEARSPHGAAFRFTVPWRSDSVS
jgi:PAS domain S-box-containing protein